ncbi:uncharacterized protein LOC109595292 isoform X2 [Aethina tumida]|uniref:uncharacterized protein LOC109595292 isoform X2 n=1 Tax=Aethina tumida TaxID=116153 RepID=UPI002147C5B9|nr:uncharacterized protein LOC109595292 isoform X2 [Aethina tumida]
MIGFFCHLLQVSEKSTLRRCRSMSDGSTKRSLSDDTFEIFPSLPNSVLEKMGLRGNNPRENLTEEEQEQKFTSLSLAFTIDSSSIKDRYERQRRQRDQTENNLLVELERLNQKINKMKYLCIDFETTELLTGLLTQVDIVTKASYLASISAERYGAVQYEEKLSDSVMLMVSHVNALKQQRDNSKRQLEYTKRVIQETNIDSENNNTLKMPKKLPTRGGKSVTRRASIATISQTADIVRPSEIKKITRRKSDLSICTSTPMRSNRPSRFDLNVDLVKISEGVVEVEHSNEDSDSRLEQSDAPEENEDESSVTEDPGEYQVKEAVPVTLKQKVMYKIRTMENSLEMKFIKWSSSFTTETFHFCAIICFVFSLVIMANILIELELSKMYNNT